MAGHSGFIASKGASRSPVNFSLDDCQDVVSSVKLPPGVTTDNSLEQGRWRRKKSKYIVQACYKSKKYRLARGSDPEELGRIYRDFRANPEKWLEEHGRKR